MSVEPTLAAAAATPGRPSSDKPVALDQPNGTAPSASTTADAVAPPRSSSKGPAPAHDPTQDPPQASATGEGTATPADEPKKKRSLLSIPRSNSQSSKSQTLTSTGLSGKTVADNESIGRGSKRSFLGKRRAGSTASSKRSQQPATSEKADQVPPVPSAEPREGSTKSKTRKSGGLLACLPCFAPKEDRSARDDVPAENAKQATKAKPVRTSQSTPVKKQDPASEPSAADATEPLDEKTAGETYAAERLGKPNGDGAAERPSSEMPPKIVTRSSSNKKSPDQPLPPLPNQPDALQTGHPQINIQTPTPGTTPVQPRPSHEQERIIHDRTESQEEKDQDIEMKDVPLSASEVPHDDDESSSEAKHEPDLPPPPPLEQRRDAVRDQTSEISASEPQQKYLLGPLRPEFKGKKCLVLDLDETLVHSSFKILAQADFTIPVEIEGQYHNVYVIKRPGVDQFMKRVGELYEVVVFTASVSKYGDPLLDQLDIHGVVHHRLFRESCYNHQGNYVKDLSQIGRDLKDTIIIDNSPTSYIFHPQHAVPISSWFSDAHDNELLDLIPVLEDLAGSQVSDVSLVLDVGL